MKAKILMGLTGVLMALSSAMGVTITATSSPFTFPALVGVKDGRFITKAATYFKHSGYSSKSGVVTFAWSLPDEMKAQRGSIAIYSMLGRMVKSIPITSAAGVATWKTSHMEGVGGLYVAKLTYGSHKQNLKLILCK
jgi:hypothetical protein